MAAAFVGPPKANGLLVVTAVAGDWAAEAPPKANGVWADCWDWLLLLFWLLLMEAAAAPKIPPPDCAGAAVPNGDGAGAVADAPPKTELALEATPTVEAPNTDELVPNTPPAEADVVVADAPKAGGLVAPAFIPKGAGVPPVVPPNFAGPLLEPVPNMFAVVFVVFDKALEAPKLNVALLPACVAGCGTEVGAGVAALPPPNAKLEPAEVEV